MKISMSYLHLDSLLDGDVEHLKKIFVLALQDCISQMHLVSRVE